MLNLSPFALLGRLVRQDDPDSLGVPTTVLLKDAIDAGRVEEAKSLADYTIGESKSLHDLFCDWIWHLLTAIAARHGEAEMHEMLRASQTGWMRRSWSGFLRLPVASRVQLTAEIMRAHHGGPAQDGTLKIEEDDASFAIVMDPCGSGGRMRRGDPVDGTPSRLGPPYSFGTTKEPHPWSFGRKDVPYYCVHCAVNETLMMEWGGHPLWVTEFDPDAAKPCVWRFYKTAEAIPVKFYARAGREKPAPGAGKF
jgi:hypothetical protein